jgi:hypothetical protein
MSGETIKLTVRLPAELHRALKERAVEYNVSLNQAVVDALAAEIKVEPPEDETERERVRRIMRENGMLADASWADDLARELLGDDPLPALEEVRDWLAGVPLTEWIIEDRGPR